MDKRVVWGIIIVAVIVVGFLIFDGGKGDVDLAPLSIPTLECPEERVHEINFFRDLPRSRTVRHDLIEQSAQDIAEENRGVCEELQEELANICRNLLRDAAIRGPFACAGCEEGYEGGCTPQISVPTDSSLNDEPDGCVIVGPTEIPTSYDSGLERNTVAVSEISVTLPCGGADSGNIKLACVGECTLIPPLEPEVFDPPSAGTAEGDEKKDK
jgi:hypothetical protein